MIVKLIRWANINPSNSRCLSITYKTEFQAKQAMKRQQDRSNEIGDGLDWSKYIQVKLEGEYQK